MPRDLEVVEDESAYSDLKDGSVVLEETGDIYKRFNGRWVGLVFEEDGDHWISGSAESPSVPGYILIRGY